MHNGWIKLHRKIQDNPIYSDSDMLKLWVHCLLKASHRERSQLIGNQMVELEPGDFVTGRQSLSDEFNNGVKKGDVVSPITLWRWLNNFEKWGMLNIKKTTKYSVVSVVGWGEHQHDEQQVNNKRTTDEQQVITNKNVKNDKNEKKDHIPHVEIISYLNEKTGKKYKHTTAGSRKAIAARWNEGNDLGAFKKVIDICCEKWKGQIFSNGTKGDEYLRPSTLFNEKFDERLNWSTKKESEVAPQYKELGGKEY